MVGNRSPYRCMGLCPQSAFAVTPGPPRTGARGSVSSWCAATCGDQARKTTSFFAAGRLSRRARITSAPAVTSAAASATAAHRRPHQSPARRRACGARRGDRRHAQAEARVTSPPACAPRGACLRRARLRRLRSGPAAPASGLACGPPLSAAKRTAGARKTRAATSAQASRQPSRHARHGRHGCAPAAQRAPGAGAPGVAGSTARRNRAGLSAHAAPAVTPVAPAAWRHGSCMHRPKYTGGAKRPPETPRPPAPGVRALWRRRLGHARHGRDGRAAHPGAKSARGRSAAVPP